MTRLSDWMRRVRELDQEGEADLFSWSGYVSLVGVCVSITSAWMGTTFAIARDTEGLLLVVVIQLACILPVVATRPAAR